MHTPSLPQMRLIPPIFVVCLLGCNSYCLGAIAPSTERELKETLGLDICCLIPMTVGDASEPLGTLAPPSTCEA